MPSQNSAAVPRIVSIVRTEAMGLSTLSRMFNDYIGFHRTLAISPSGGKSFHDRGWYGQNSRYLGTVIPDGKEVRWLLDGAEILLIFETPYTPVAPLLANAAGVKVVLMPMYECLPMSLSWFGCVNACLCPSELDYDEILRTPVLCDTKVDMLHVPCDTRHIPFRLRETARVFVHNMGHGGIHGRNGTKELLEAWRFVESPAKLLIRTQEPFKLPHADKRIELREVNLENYWELWGDGDVLIHPHQWDGLSLPIQEAMTAGMPAIQTSYWPFCDAGDRMGWVPPSLQQLGIDAEPFEAQVSRKITGWRIEPWRLAGMVDRWYGQEIKYLSLAARRHAELIGWPSLRSSYVNWFCSLLSGGKK